MDTPKIVLKSGSLNSFGFALTADERAKRELLTKEMSLLEAEVGDLKRKASAAVKLMNAKKRELDSVSKLRCPLYQKENPELWGTDRLPEAYRSAWREFNLKKAA